MNSPDDTLARQRCLEQASLHLLAAEGELAAVIDETSDRNASQANVESRLRQARAELNQARQELHRTANLMNSITLTQSQLGFVADDAFLHAYDEDDLAKLSEATQQLRLIYQGLGGTSHFDDYDDDILSRAHDKKARKKKLATIGMSILLLLGLPYVGCQINNHPERVENALWERLTPHCEKHPECLQALGSSLPDCAKAQVRWGRLLINTLASRQGGDAPSLIEDWSDVVDCINRAAGKRILDEILVTTNMTPSAFHRMHNKVGIKSGYKPELDLPIGQLPNEKKP